MTNSKDVDRRELTTEELIDRMEAAKAGVSDAGRPDAVERQHELGKLTARERVAYLVDDGTFRELGQLAGPAPRTPETMEWNREDAPYDGVVTGIGEVAGRPVAITATDFTIKGGSSGLTGGRKNSRIADLALRRGFPLVALYDAGGHRIQEGLDARSYAHGGDFRDRTKLSGWVPQVAAIMGPAFGGPVNAAASCDFIPMVEGTATMGVAGPALANAALGTDLDKWELGGTDFHMNETGMADQAYPDDEACLDAVRAYLSYLPRNASHEPPRTDDWESPYESDVERLASVIPTNTTQGYDIHVVIDGIVDRDSFFELKPAYARNIVTGFARLEGHPIGIVANNPRIMAGTFDVPATDKSSKFISTCDAFNVPLLFLMDTPGVMPGPDAERQGIIRHAGKPMFEMNRATVPKVSVVMRRGYGFGYVLMAGGRSTTTDLTAVWPTAEIAAMGIEGAVDLAYDDVYEAADDPDAKREKLIRTFINRTGAIRAVEHFGVDAAIDPRETREWIASTLEMADGVPADDWPPKKHGINPL